MKVLAVIDIDDTTHAPLEVCKIYDEGDTAFWDSFFQEALNNLQYRNQISKTEEFNQIHLKALFEMLIKQGVLTTQGLQLEPLIMHSVEKHYAQTKFRWSWRKKKTKQLEEKYLQASSAFQTRVKENIWTATMLWGKKFFKSTRIGKAIIDAFERLDKK
ncbi:hypothetical protein [Flectobacillus roseus]|uniref:Transposase n=1 Tax=Flectobacillus roseus TaxID=502259 RepID=A0ABT6YG52_9BACT|nr:hypothetical protein [Flectobacillus roseus]MDI9862579.1 hypothetical protein [Flectobacillus roseus]